MTPMFCTECCCQSHELHPFHRIDHWAGSHFELVWLFQVGVVLHFGHSGKPFSSYFDTSALVPKFQEAVSYKDNIDNTTEGDGSNNITKELKWLAGIYDLTARTYSLPAHCHELTVVDISSVH
jgi:hypothetical protein